MRKAKLLISTIVLLVPLSGCGTIHKILGTKTSSSSTPETKNRTDGGVVDNGMTKAYPILANLISIEMSDRWQLTTNEAQVARFEMQDNSLAVTRETGTVCDAAKKKNSFGVEISECSQTMFAAYLESGKAIKLTFQNPSDDFGEIMGSIRPIFELGKYVLEMHWTENLENAPPPYVKGLTKNHIGMNVTASPSQPSSCPCTDKACTPDEWNRLCKIMAGFHAVTFDYQPTETCTTQGFGYSWDNGSFWFANCDPRGAGQKYEYREVPYFYLKGDFFGPASGQGTIILTPKGASMMEDGPAVGTFRIYPSE